MKILSVSLVWLGMLFVAGSNLCAQSAEALARIQSTIKQLQLTPQQELKLVPILKAEAPKIEAIKNNDTLSKLEKLNQLRAVHDESAPEVQKILTPTQYERLQAIREKNIKRALAKKRGES